MGEVRIKGIPWRKYVRHHINIVRWWLDRCDGCGHRFAWKGDPRHGLNRQTYHDSCIALLIWRTKADERLRVLDAVMDLSALTPDDVKFTMSLRAHNGQPGSGSDEWNIAWRVFRDLGMSVGQ